MRHENFPCPSCGHYTVVFEYSHWVSDTCPCCGQEDPSQSHIMHDVYHCEREQCDWREAIHPSEFKNFKKKAGGKT